MELLAIILLVSAAIGLAICGGLLYGRWLDRTQIAFESEIRHLQAEIDELMKTPEYYAQSAEILKPYKGTIGTCGYFEAKAKVFQPKDV